jgi:multisubunit Na+/H+ antiporter MnhG subunit
MWGGALILLAGVVFTALAVARGGEDDASRWILLTVFVALTWPVVLVLGLVFGVLNLLWRGLAGAMKP